MSEKLPEKKVPSVRLNCENCDETFESNYTTGKNYVYTKQPWFNNFQVQHVGSCDEVTVVFHDRPTEAEMDAKELAQLTRFFKSIVAQYPTSVYEYLDDCDKDEPNESDWIKYRRQEVLKIQEIELHDLIPKQREYVEHWGEFLQRVMVDATDFTDGSAA